MKILIKIEIDHQSQSNKIIEELKLLVANWLPVERPKSWYECKHLEENEIGKIETKKLHEWLLSKSLLQTEIHDH